MRLSPKRGTRSALRDATAALHDQIEALWAPDAQFASFSVYLAFLERLRSAHLKYGLPAARLRGNGAEIAVEEERIAALATDLNRPAPAIPPTQLSASAAWGVGYVLNGSALGATIILRDGAIQPGWPRRYMLLGQRYAKAGMLRRYFDAMDSANLDLVGVQQGAHLTFAHFQVAPSEGFA